MFAYPSIAEASPSFSYLAGLIRKPSSWDNATGLQHLWTAQGAAQSLTFGEGSAGPLAMSAQSMASWDAEKLAAHVDSLAACNSGAVSAQAFGNGLLLKLITGLITKFLESGAAEDWIKKLLENLFKPKV